MSRPRCKCGKVSHPTKERACIAATRMKNCAMNVYKCEHGQWHLGRTRDAGRCADRVGQVLRQYDAALAKRLEARAS